MSSGEIVNLEHVALWTRDLTAAHGFYTAFFGAEAGPVYANASTGFRSYFLTFPRGSRLELMQMPGIAPRGDDATTQRIGIAHLAFDAGSPAAVDALMARLQAHGCAVESAARTTGDGYYEGTVFDPDGNRIEIVTRADSAAG